jgi:hypothetical protein
MRPVGKRFIMAAAVFALAQAGVVAAASAAYAAPVYNRYQITNVHSGLCLVPKGDSIQPQTPIVQVTCSSDLQQRWTSTFAGLTGPFMYNPFPDAVTADAHDPSFCIGTPSGGFPVSGTKAVLMTGGGCRTILLVGVPTDAYLEDGQTGLCLDISGASMSQNAPLIFYTCHGGTNQQWWNNG